MAGGDRSTADAALIAALLGGSTIQDAAKAASISEATARRRLREPSFQRELNEGRREIIATIAARLAGLTDKALERYVAVLEDPHASHGTVIAAFEKALRHLAALSEVADASELGERLGRIERRLGLAAVDEEAAA